MTKEDRELHLLNLVSRGMSLPEARKHLGIAAPVAEEPAPPEPVADRQDELAKLRALLDSKGINYHPNAKSTTLRRKLEESELL